MTAARDDRGPPDRPSGAGPGANRPSSGDRAAREGSSSRAEGGSGPGGGGDGAAVTLALAGDVMTGRGVDQVLPHSVDPQLHERYVGDARRYVELAEEEHGPIPAPVAHDYPWGDALGVLERIEPDGLVVNLETPVTTHDGPWSGKGIHYRMHPGNVPLLTAAGVDVCVLANNHALDWGRAGLEETLRSLRDAGLATAGAGADGGEAAEPAVVEAGGTRVLVFGFATTDAGVPRGWAAGPTRSGVALLPSLDAGAVRDVGRCVAQAAGDDDLVVVSLHWGSNWGWDVPARQRRFARRLIEEAGVDLVHGHSSHHPRGIGIHRGRPVLYGCGDLLNDYEGISGHEEFRPDLAALYLVAVDADAGRLGRLEAVPFRRRRFRLQRATGDDAGWLARTLDRHSRELGASVELTPEETLRVQREEAG